MRFEESRHRAVRRDHEVLDHIGGGVLLRLLDCRYLAMIADGSRFHRLDLERTIVDASLAQSSRNFRLQPELCLQPANSRCLLWSAGPVIDPVANSGIRQLRLVRHPSPVYVGRLHRSIDTDHHLHHHGFPIRCLEERSRTSRQLCRNHRKDDSAGVDGGSLRRRVGVDRRTLGRI